LFSWSLGGVFRSLSADAFWVGRALFAQKKAPAEAGAERMIWGLALEAHHLGHRGRNGIETGMELGIVVLDRGGGVLQTITGEHADHG